MIEFLGNRFFFWLNRTLNWWNRLELVDWSNDYNQSIILSRWIQYRTLSLSHYVNDCNRRRLIRNCPIWYRLFIGCVSELEDFWVRTDRFQFDDVVYGMCMYHSILKIELVQKAYDHDMLFFVDRVVSFSMIQHIQKNRKKERIGSNVQNGGPFVHECGFAISQWDGGWWEGQIDIVSVSDSWFFSCEHVHKTQ